MRRRAALSLTRRALAAEAELVRCIALAVPCRDHAARCEGVAARREVMPRVVLAPWAHRLTSVIDLLGSDPRNPAPPLEPHPDWVPVVWRPLWGARDRSAHARACCDPRRHTLTCPALPDRILLDTRLAL